LRIIITNFVFLSKAYKFLYFIYNLQKLLAKMRNKIIDFFTVKSELYAIKHLFINRKKEFAKADGIQKKRVVAHYYKDFF
jgi:hypothetical protein